MNSLIKLRRGDYELDKIIYEISEQLVDRANVLLNERNWTWIVTNLFKSFAVRELFKWAKSINLDSTCGNMSVVYILYTY